MNFNDLFNGVEIAHIKGNTDLDITGINIDSRKVKPGDAFICISGAKFEGHDFANDAIKAGAKVIVCERDLDLQSDVTVVKVKDTRAELAKLACNFYNNPSKELKVVGITGTKGKTTTTYMMKSCLEAKGLKVGLIGTIEIRIGDKKLDDSHNTTPDALDLQKLFRRMVDENVDVVVMEVSSHALEAHRVDGIDFDIAIFTNLTQEHMDFHKNFENYYNAKKKLFNMCKLALINVDSEYGMRLKGEMDCHIKTMSIEKNGDIVAKNLNIEARKVTFDVESSSINGELQVGIPGKFSVYNSLVAIAVANEFNLSKEEVQKGFDNLRVPGRSELVDIGKDYTVMVDYAHSPDSLKNILEATKEYAKARIICVFGCGGDRDRTKRPMMGRVAAELSDYVVITSDNPRTEDPVEITKEVEKGIEGTDCEYKVIVDRAEAIKHAMSIAKTDDIILIAGKGHENYQILKDRTIHFDDKEVVMMNA